MTHEVFGDNADYVLGREARENPTHPKLRALGRMARLFASDEQAQKLQQGYDRISGKLRSKVRELNEMRRTEKTERKAPGTIDFVIEHAAETDGMDQLMQIAAERARLQLNTDLPPLPDPDAPLPRRQRDSETPQPPREFTHASAGSTSAALDTFYEQYSSDPKKPDRPEPAHTSTEDPFEPFDAARPPRSHRRRGRQPRYTPLHPASRGATSSKNI